MADTKRVPVPSGKPTPSRGPGHLAPKTHSKPKPATPESGPATPGVKKVQNQGEYEAGRAGPIHAPELR